MNHSDFNAFQDAAASLLERLGTRQQLLLPNVNGTPVRRDDWKQLAASGWFRLLLQEERGGLGLDAQAVGAIFLAMGKQPIRGPLLDHVVKLPLLRAAIGDVSASRLEAALDGELLLAFGEALPPPYGSGATGLQIADGVLRGAAELVPFAQWADAFVMLAYEDGEPVLVLLDSKSARISECSSVDPCADYARLDFPGASVKASDILLRGAEARVYLRCSTSMQRLALAAEISGCASEMVDMSVDFAKTRRQFGRPIGSFQAMQHLLADMAAQARALRSLVHACLADACSTPERMGELGMIAKTYACTVGREISQNALQVHGGIGFTTELPLHLYMRRIFTYQGMLGETDALLVDLGADALREGQSA